MTESGLFFFLSTLDKETKLKIVEWFNKLSKEEQEFVNILRYEAIDESLYFNQ